MISSHRITKTILLPDIEWVEIFAGDFLYGEDNQTQYLDRFYISKYPITNRQFQTFIDDDGGYEDKYWWENLDRTLFQESESPQLNRPKTDVNWYEALAFTRWLSNHLGYMVSLPTEQQWEKAARGSSGAEYPWGDFKPGYANFNDKLNGGADLGQTTAVGVYPHGNTLTTGVADMSGNVSEWCLNKYVKPEIITPDSNDTSGARVHRGGYWGNISVPTKASIRYKSGPHNRGCDMGFRVVCVLPFTSL